MNDASTRYACPVCGTVHTHQSDRYKNHACHDCEKRARCSHDRIVVGYNTHLGGGFEAHHADTKNDVCAQVTATGRVHIDGIEIRMREAKFGGTVCTPLSRIVPVVQTIVWSRDGHIEWTSSGVPRPFVGFVGEKTVRSGLRRTSKWEWMVRNPGAKHIVKQGISDTPEDAKARVIEVLDHMNVLLYEDRREASDRTEGPGDQA